MQNNIIGVLGGCGPYAGIHLVKSIFDQTGATKDQDHVPLYLSSVPGAIADRTTYLLDAETDNPAHAIADLICQMEKVGVSVAGIACNTSHAPEIYDVIQADLERAGCRIRLLHIVEETVAYLREICPMPVRVGILGTDGTFKTRLYDNRLRHAGFTVITPSPAFQHEIIHNCVYHGRYGIKARSSPVTEWAKTRLDRAIEYFRNEGAEAIILGCTEFSLAIPGPVYQGLKMVDSVRALARGLLLAAYPDKLITWPENQHVWK